MTIDPARDDAAAMKQYVTITGPGTSASPVPRTRSHGLPRIGASTTAGCLESVNGYAMAHSTETYLLDAEGRLRHHIFFGAGADLIAEKLREVAGMTSRDRRATKCATWAS